MDFKQLRSKLNESSDMNAETIPAPMLVLRRKGVRIFPDGKRVALYVNDKYNLTFTVPYGGTHNADSPLIGRNGNG